MGTQCCTADKTTVAMVARTANAASTTLEMDCLWQQTPLLEETVDAGIPNLQMRQAIGVGARIAPVAICSGAAMPAALPVALMAKGANAARTFQAMVSARQKWQSEQASLKPTFD